MTDEIKGPQAKRIYICVDHTGCIYESEDREQVIAIAQQNVESCRELLEEWVAWAEGLSPKELDNSMKKLVAERDEAIKAMGEWAEKCGEAQGELKASEMAGVVEAWQERAKKAESERDEALARVAELDAAVEAAQWAELRLTYFADKAGDQELRHRIWAAFSEYNRAFFGDEASLIAAFEDAIQKNRKEPRHDR